MNITKTLKKEWLNLFSFFRIIGLLNILGDKKYLQYYNENNLFDFINRAKKYNSFEPVVSSFHILKDDLIKFQNIKYIDYFKPNLNSLNLSKSQILGTGNEGIIFKDNNDYIYKCFYKKLSNKQLLEKVKDGNVHGIPKFELLNFYEIIRNFLFIPFINKNYIFLYIRMEIKYIFLFLSLVLNN